MSRQEIETSQTAGSLLRAAAALSRTALAEPAGELAAIAALCALLLAAALWNGFPIFFYDTGAYVFEGLGHVFLAERSAVYSLFVLVAGGGISLWFVAVVQAAMTAFVMVQVARVLTPRLTLAGMLAVGCMLTVATGLPWYAGEIEPDFLTALAVLSLYLLAFHAQRFDALRKGLLVAVAAFSIAAHPSHFCLAGGLLLALGVLKVVPARRRGLPQPKMKLPVLSFAIGMSLVIVANFIYTQAVFISRSGPVFVFARLVQDGIIMRLLDDTCPGSHYALCAYRDELPVRSDEYLWTGESPFYKLGRFQGTAAQSQTMIFDSLKRYPLMHLKTAARDATQQFIIFKTGDLIEAQEWILHTDLERVIPAQMHAYLAARQQRGQLDFRPINIVHVPVGWMSLICLVLAMGAAWRLRDMKTAVFLGLILASLIGNAVICGVLSTPHDRYQSRLMWLPAFALALLVASRNPALRLRGESGT